MNSARKTRATIIEIAKVCGVSKTTVGYALNEETADKVSDAKKKLINKTAEKLGYVPNRSAQTLRTGKTRIIGVILPEPANNFYGRIALEIQRRLAEKDYTATFVFFRDIPDTAVIGKAIRMFAAHNVDGIIAGKAAKSYLAGNRTPTVFWQNTQKGFDSVSTYLHVKKIYRELIDVLTAKGCKKFAVMAPHMDSGRTPRILDVLRKAGIPPLPEEYLLDGVSSAREAAQAAEQKILAMKKRPDVLLCNNDAIAVGAMSAMIKAGIKVPEEMKFAGFDSTDMAEHSVPALTTFEVPVPDVAKKLLTLLFRRMKNKNAKTLNLSVKPKLIIRNST